MLLVANEESDGHQIPIVVLPLLTPRLSSYWLALVTDVDVTTGRNLIDSMATEVVVRDTSIRDVVPGEEERGGADHDEEQSDDDGDRREPVDSDHQHGQTECGDGHAVAMLRRDGAQRRTGR